jgi:hypothetical protein
MDDRHERAFQAVRGAEHRSDKRELGAIGARRAGKSNEPDVRSTTVPAKAVLVTFGKAKVTRSRSERKHLDPA